jgi:hypothetical protein
MSRITIDVLERQAEAMGLKVFGIRYSRHYLRPVLRPAADDMACRLVERPAEALHPMP